MPTTPKETDRWSSFVGTRSHPLEVYVDPHLIQDSMEDRVHMSTMRAAFQSLREGYGFGIAIHNLTPADYADILRSLEPHDSDITTGLSSQPAPLVLDKEYLGIESSASLTQYTAPPGKHVSDLLESLVIAHQYILSKVCGKGGLHCGDEVEQRQEMDDMVDQEVWTLSVMRFSVRVPALKGMQDFLRVVYDPKPSLFLERSRSILYNSVEVLHANSAGHENCSWLPTLLSGTKSKDEAYYTVYTLLPSVSGGLVLEGDKEIGTYITKTEEVIRGHTSDRENEGRYYEWVAPTIAGDKTRRTRTYYLTIGCSLIIPSTFAVRIGSNPKQEVVVFAHCIRVTLPEGEEMIFMSRPSSYTMSTLDEYGNTTEFLQPDALSQANLILPIQNSSALGVDLECVVGTIPTVANISLNTASRKNVVHSAMNLDLGPAGVAQAYMRTPFYRFIAPGASKRATKFDTGGIRFLQEGWNEEFVVRNVPYNYFEFISGKPLSFPLSLARIWELEIERRDSSLDNHILSNSDSESSISSSENEESRSGATEEKQIRRSPRLRSKT